jgi:hypothetical protein
MIEQNCSRLYRLFKVSFGVELWSWKLGEKYILSFVPRLGE